MSSVHSRAATALSRARTASAANRTATAKSRAMTATDRAATAKSVGSAGGGSRPCTATSKKSVAWSDQDPEQGEGEEEDDGEVKLSKELEEELNRDTSGGKGDGGPVGCWAGFTGFISSLWDTTDMKPGEEREVIVRTSLRELIIYLLFLAVLCIVTLSAMSNTMFRYTTMVKSLFKEYKNVKLVNGFWDYMETDFLDGLYWEEWYNDGDDYINFPCPGNENATGPCPIDQSDRMLMHANRLLGVPRLRQIRVRNNTCSIPEQFESKIKVCYGLYSEDGEDTESFGPGWRNVTSSDAWRYQTVKELDGNSYYGREATYSGAGSIQNLREKREDTLAIIKELREGLWIGRGTRYVVVDFTIYNANVNLFCVIKLNFEFPPTGGILPYGSFATVKLLRYITPWEYSILGAELIFGLFLIYYFIEEILEARVMRLQYFTSFWNILDQFVLWVATATLVFNIYTVFRVSLMLKSLLAEPEKFSDFSFLESWSKTFQDAAGLTIYAGFIKIFKYISFNKTMSQLSGTISKCAGDVAAFSIMFYIVFFGYAQVGYLLFGSYVRVFSNLKYAMFTQTRLILGDFDFPAIEKANRIWGPAWFISYVLLVFFVLVNMFLAIINDTYSEVKEEVNNRREEFQVGDYVMRGYNNVREMFYTRDKLIDIKETVKLAADDGVVTYDEVRDSLRKLNFSDLEIEIFCARYDKDGNYTFDLDEINAIEQNLGEQIANFDHLILENEKRLADEADKPLDNHPKMNKMQFAVLTHRVDSMERQMTGVVDKVEQVLKKLEAEVGPPPGTTGQQPPPSRGGSAISRGMRDIASAKDRSDEEKKADMEDLVKDELNKIEDSE